MFLLQPCLIEARDVNDVNACKRRLGMVGEKIRAYEKAYGELPPDLAALADEFGMDTEELMCPIRAARSAPYVYVPPSGEAPGDTIIACDRYTHRGLQGEGGHNWERRVCLLLSGTVTSLDEAGFHERLAKPENAGIAKALHQARP